MRRYSSCTGHNTTDICICVLWQFGVRTVAVRGAVGDLRRTCKITSEYAEARAIGMHISGCAIVMHMQTRASCRATLVLLVPLVSSLPRFVVL